MNVLLWVLQGVLAFLYLAGGYFKALKFDELAGQLAYGRYAITPLT
jgi:hypothetical protein